MLHVKQQKAKHSYYRPVNINKYVGKYPIRCMSSWEHAFCRWCDYNNNILEWSSESIKILYKHPFKKDHRGLTRIATYYPDFLITVNGHNNSIRTILIEIKPFKETHPPKQRRNKSHKSMLYEEKTWAINSAKWKAAELYCSKRKWEFKIITEKELKI